MAHDHKHDIDSATEHTGVSGAALDNFVSFTAAGLPQDSGYSASSFGDISAGRTITGLWTFDRNPLAPFAVTLGSAVVPYLDADKVDGYHHDQSLLVAASPTFVRLTSSQATGTAPFTVASTTVVPNLNVDRTDGYDFDQALLVASTPSFARLGIGTTTIPHAATGHALLAIEGADSSPSAGPWVQWTTDADDYPLLAILPYVHDDIYMVWDAYLDTAGQWRSSDGSQYMLRKNADTLYFLGDTGVAAGSPCTFESIAYFGRQAAAWQLVFTGGNRIQFRDSDIWIGSILDGYLDIDADVAVRVLHSLQAQVNVTSLRFIIGAHELAEAEWHYLDGQDQSVFTTSSPAFVGVTLTGNLTMPEDGWIGIASNAERLVFDGTGGLIDAHAATAFRLTTTGVVSLTSPANGVLQVAGDLFLIDSGSDPRLVIGDSTGAGNWGGIRWVSASDSIGIGTDTGGVDTLLISEAGNVLLAGTGQFQLGDTGTYIWQSADSVLSYVADGRHEFTGGPVYVGTGTPGHTITGVGDLYVADRLEVDGAAYFDDQTYFYGQMDCRDQHIMSFYGSTFGGLYRLGGDGLHFYVYGGAGTVQNRNLIICDYAARADDYDHSAISADPTLFVHSTTRAASETDEWWSITHDVTDAIYNVGSGLHKFTTGHVRIDSTNQLQFAGANEYFSSDAAGYLDAHFSDDDKGMRFYSGANLLYTLSRYSAGLPTYTRINYEDHVYVYRAGVARYSTSNIYAFVFYANTIHRDNIQAKFGTGADAAQYYNTVNLIIDPDLVGTGWVHIGATHDDGLWAGEFKCGDATNYSQFEADGSQVFVGTAGIAHGGISVVDNAVVTTVGVAGTYVQFLGFDTNSPSNNVTPDHTNDHITIDKAGVYGVVASFCVTSVGAGAADHISFQLKKNGGTVSFAELKVQRKLAGGGDDIGSVSMSGEIDVDATDTIEVWVTDEDNADDILIVDANVYIHQLSGT